MNLAYIADARCNHGYRWLDYFSKENSVIIICLESQKDTNYYIGHPRVKVYPILPNVYPLKDILLRKKITQQIKKILKENNCDLVHSMYAVPYSFYGYLSGSKDHIITTRGSDVFVNYKNFSEKSARSPANFLLKKLYERTFNKARNIAFDSYTQKTKIESFLKNKEKGSVIRMGVNLDLFLKHGLNETKKDEIVIFSNRSMTPLYNIDKIIHAFKMIKDQNPSLKIKLKTTDYYNVPSYLEKIKKLIKQLGLSDSVEILPAQNTVGLIKYYFDSDIVIMIPSSDGSAVSGAEAMLMKKPLIIGPIEYDKDLYNDETVWRLDDFNPATIAETISNLLSLPKEQIQLKTDKAFNSAVQNADFDKEVLKLKKLYHTVSDTVHLMTNPEYKICTQCILSTKDDPNITFNEKGICNYCIGYENQMKRRTFSNPEEKLAQLNAIVKKVSEAGKGKKYDCIIGVSGGVDSTYLVYKAKMLGLRPLIVHYDNGWDSEIAVENITNLVTKLDLDLYTYVNDWEEFKDIQLSFFKASVIDIELITDQAIVALLFKLAVKYKIKYLLMGNNVATESVLPTSWYHWKLDVLNIEAIHEKFGKVKLKTYPRYGFWKMWYTLKFRNFEYSYLLDFLDYNKEEAKQTIIKELGWRDYGGKHYESVFTRFYQSYILPQKFGVDKRKAHLSSLILSGQITREQALEEIKKEIYSPERLKEDKDYVLKKLGLSEKEFDGIMKLPIVPHTFYPSYITKHYKLQEQFSKFVRKFIPKK